MSYYEMIYYTGQYDSDGGFTSMLVELDNETINKLLSDDPPAFIKVMADEGEIRILNTMNINMFKHVLGITNPQGDSVEVQ